jgi:hypothetical protein
MMGYAVSTIKIAALSSRVIKPQLWPAACTAVIKRVVNSPHNLSILPADCCDGSDEQPKVCKNTCIEKSAGHRVEIQERVDKYRRALDKRASIITSASEVKAGWAAQSGTIHADIKAQESEIERLEGKSAAYMTCSMCC